MTTDAHRSRTPRFGLTTATPRTGTQLREFARTVEAAGFDVLTFADHLGPLAPPFTTAAAAVTATERLHVGTLVLNNDFRHPVETARESAGLATLSDGRFELGIGAGHMKSEYDAAGLQFDDAGVRVSRMIEAVAVIRALLDGARVDHDGEHYRVHADAASLVAPAPARVPLLIGGNGRRVLRLAGRVADIAGLAGITHNRDATEVRLSHFDPAGLADRIAVVADAAGERFERIELNALIQAVVATDQPRRAAEHLGETLGVAPDALIDSPFVLLGTHEQMAEQLVARQRRFGVSYWTVFDELPGRPSAMPDLAEVIKLLS
ncbi:TIGR03621 family F420-dependent LLM class oxidoreductase [Mycolicibacterium flavescens]|uniref:F420-dependent oxidoreductase n=1 Tax=Mycolicibacterium flavescens TaxID=1776 RepID=A0A1E3RQT9_MYCFV|nr:TIGR03621 family F420-dependent LLM class oxidoreductase [Mycolicibacterium flavescens]MCV7279611.1 TIGR03621 family F420-dependent LLM class oxidoreductase [Mycolicibacterium flavescens]ODQ92263.1 F420-dependent oxidoreductase [Mycolicibacterium flavescens]